MTDELSAALPIEIDVHSAHRFTQPPTNVLLLDCRTVAEHAHVAIPGAILIPMDEIAARLAELEPQKNARIIVHCHHGGRSLRVANWLREQGYAQTQSMAGGIDAWAEQIDPQLLRY